MPDSTAPAHIQLTRQHARHAMGALRMVMHMTEELRTGPPSTEALAQLACWDDTGAAIGQAIDHYKRGETACVELTVPHAACAAMALQALDMMGLHGNERTTAGKPVMAEAAHYLHEQLADLPPERTVCQGRFRHPVTGVEHTYSTTPYWPVYESNSPHEAAPPQAGGWCNPDPGGPGFLPPYYGLYPVPLQGDGMLDLPAVTLKPPPEGTTDEAP